MPLAMCVADLPSLMEGNRGIGTPAEAERTKVTIRFEPVQSFFLKLTGDQDPDKPLNCHVHSVLILVDV